jgi:glycosyltransferase involved in cell wall biosynthesis
MSPKKIILCRITTSAITLDTLLKNQLRYLNDYFEVIAISSDSEKLKEVSNREGVAFKYINMEREISIFRDFISLFKFIFYFIFKKPNIIHSSTPKSSLLSMIAGYLTNIEHRIYMITGLRYESTSGFKRVYLILFEKITCFFSTKIIAESIGVRNKLISDGITKRRISIIGSGNINGIDLDYWDPCLVSKSEILKIQHKHNLTDNSYVFIFIGRIVEDKGVNELVMAFNQICKNYCKVCLLILGSIEKNNPISSETYQLIVDNENIILTDYIEDIRPYLLLSNCLILPSYREGFPNVILQAGAMGKPVIMTPVNGHHEYLNEWNGDLISMKDVNSLITQMEKYINQKKVYNSEEIRGFVINKFSQKNLFSSLLKYYNTL